MIFFVGNGQYYMQEVVYAGGLADIFNTNAKKAGKGAAAGANKITKSAGDDAYKIVIVFSVVSIINNLIVTHKNCS